MNREGSWIPRKSSTIPNQRFPDVQNQDAVHFHQSQYQNVESKINGDWTPTTLNHQPPTSKYQRGCSSYAVVAINSNQQNLHVRLHSWSLSWSENLLCHIVSVWGVLQMGLSKMVGLQWKIPISNGWVSSGVPLWRNGNHYIGLWEPAGIRCVAVLRLRAPVQLQSLIQVSQTCLGPRAVPGPEGTVHHVGRRTTFWTTWTILDVDSGPLRFIGGIGDSEKRQRDN